MPEWIYKISELTGKAGRWASALLLLMIVTNVLLRFSFNMSFNFLLEIEWHLFALIFLLGGAYNVLHDKHVRVDFFYADFTDKTKKKINLFFNLFLLLPWTLVGAVTCFQYASNAWFIREASPNPGGIPAIYPIKFMIVVSFILVMLQAIADILKSVFELRSIWK